jgi:hypothetical protein
MNVILYCNARIDPIPQLRTVQTHPGTVAVSDSGASVHCKAKPTTATSHELISRKTVDKVTTDAVQGIH